MKKLTQRWYEHVSRRNPYIFGADIDLDDFRELIKETFDVIKTVKNEYILKNTPIEASDMFNYIELISTLSQYTTDDKIMEDESEKYSFTATIMLAEELRLYASNFHNTFSNSEEISSGNLQFELNYYVILEDGEENKIYTYNVYEGNFDEMLELANRIATDAY